MILIKFRIFVQQSKTCINMFIANARQSQRKWFYFVLPFLFFLTLFPNEDASNTMQHSIEKMGELSFLVLGLFTFCIFFLVLLIVTKYIHKQSFTSFSTARKKFDIGRFLFAFFVWGFLVVVSIFTDYLLSPKDYVWNFQLVPFLNLLVIVVLLIPFQAGFEEYFFRSYLLQGLGIICKNKWFPLIFTSLSFGFMHIANPEIDKFGYAFISVYIIMGFSMGIITLMDDGLELAWGMHSANNLFTALLVTSQWSVFQTPSLLKEVTTPEFGYEFILTILFFNLILLYIFAKKYRWTNWKENLFGKILPK